MSLLAHVPMSSLSFPTGHRHGGSRGDRRIGAPVPAEHCRCDHGALDDDTCIFCGRYDFATIRATWRLRALVVASRR